MAKKAQVNQSEAIRDYFTKHPNAKPKEVLEALKADGIEASSALVSNVKTRMKKQGGASVGRGRGRRAAQPAAVAAKTNGHSLGSTAAQLVSAIDFVKQAGGLDEARTLLDELAQVQIG